MDVDCANASTIDGTLEAIGAVPGDLDFNGTVEFADFLLLSGQFGAEVDGYRQGDINLDGSVSFADFLTLSGNFGTSSGVAAVPEPTGGLFGWCLVVCFAVRLYRRAG